MDLHRVVPGQIFVYERPVLHLRSDGQRAYVWIGDQPRGEPPGTGWHALSAGTAEEALARAFALYSIRHPEEAAKEAVRAFEQTGTMRYPYFR